MKAQMISKKKAKKTQTNEQSDVFKLKLEAFFATGKLTEAEYNELTTMLGD